MRTTVAFGATLCILFTVGTAHGQLSPPTPAPPAPAPPTTPADDPGAPATSGTLDVASLWYYAIGKDMLGPVTAGEIRRLYRLKTITAETQLWKTGMTTWLPVESVSDFSSLAASAAPTSGPTSAPPALSRAEYGHRTRTLWFYAEGPIAKGPISADDLRRLREAKKVDRNTLVWKKGLSGWARLGVLVALIGPAKTPVGAIPPPPVRAIVKAPVRTGVIGGRTAVAAAPTVIAKPKPRTPPLFRTYFTVAGLMPVVGAGGWSRTNDSNDGDLTQSFSGGFRGAFYYAFNSVFHLGVYGSLQGGVATFQTSTVDAQTRLNTTGFGAAMRLGGRAGRRVWLGLGLDVGMGLMNLVKPENSFGALQVFPRFDMDIRILSGGFKLGLNLSFGVLVTPVGNVYLTDESAEIDIWMIQPAFLVGVVFGG